MRHLGLAMRASNATCFEKGKKFGTAKSMQLSTGPELHVKGHGFFVSPIATFIYDTSILTHCYEAEISLGLARKKISLFPKRQL